MLPYLQTSKGFRLLRTPQQQYQSLQVKQALSHQICKAEVLDKECGSAMPSNISCVGQPMLKAQPCLVLASHLQVGSAIFPSILLISSTVQDEW